MDQISDVTTYKDQKDIYRDPRCYDALVLTQIHSYCMGTFGIPWKEHFFCPEASILKHRKAHITVPFVVERMNRFDAVFHGTVHETVSGSLAEAFIMWTSLVKNEGSVLYGALSFGLLVSVVLGSGASSVSASESASASDHKGAGGGTGAGAGGGAFLSYGE